MNKQTIRTLLTAVGLSIITIFSSIPLRTSAALLSQTQLSESLKVAVEKAVVAHKGEQPKDGVVVSLIKAVDTWAYGTVVIRIEDEHGSPDMMLFLARHTVSGWQVGLEPTPTFHKWLKLVPTTVMSADIKALLNNDLAAPQGDGSALLSLPWATEETVYLTKGPHPDHDGSSILAALDFSGGSRVVRSARDGIAFVSCGGSMVVVYHDGNWRTGYYHLSNISISNEQPVSRGQPLGRQSNAVGCGGSSTGAHVHFTLKSGDNLVSMVDRDIGGWNVRQSGCMVRIKDGLSRCPTGAIYNDGTIGSGNDTTLPTGNITSPANGAATNNPDITINADASDNPGGSGVNRVEFHANYDGGWRLICTDTSAPYACSWRADVGDQAITTAIHVVDNANNRAVDPGGYRVIKLDRTSPTAGFTEPASGTIARTSVTIRAHATDNLSGIAHVNFVAFYNNDWHPITTDTDAPYETTWDMAGVPDQAIQLGLDIYDVAGNVVSGGVRTLRKDTTPPTNPTTATSTGSQNNVWQKTVRQPTFNWSATTDNLAGVAGYSVYWGTNANGACSTFQTSTNFAAPSSVANVGQAATYYLRIATKDNADNSSACQTVYIFRYDSSRPTGSVVVNNGWGTTDSLNVPINMSASDTGSGLRFVRFSNTGTTWTGWRSFSPSTSWMMQGQHGDTGTVYVQFLDHAGNTSQTYSRALKLNFYAQQPASSSYRISADVSASSGGPSNSANYRMTGTTGQVFDSAAYAHSGNYRAAAGFWPLYPIPVPVVTLRNGDFERDVNNDGKPDTWSVAAQASRSNEVVRGGSYAMKHTATNDSTYTVSQVVTGLTGGANYTVSGWVNIPATTYKNGALYVWVEWYNGTTPIDGPMLVRRFGSATSGWNEFRQNLVAPIQASSAKVSLIGVQLNGTIYTDDFSFSR